MNAGVLNVANTKITPLSDKINPSGQIYSRDVKEAISNFLRDRKDKLTIENFRDDEWFNSEIWGADLDLNEVVELVLKEVQKDQDEAVIKHFGEDLLK